MGEESLQKQITVEEFEVQLRELRREKNRAEEEHENAAERWRAERRKLNSEIDRLEDEAIARARKSPAVDTGQIEQAFEEKVQQATAAWEAERERLKSEISRLQTSLADALARSGNPLRTTQAIKDQYEIKLADANRVRLEAEREFLRANSDWEEEKKRLMGELIKLRRFAPPISVQVKDVVDRMPRRSESVEEARIRELEGQLSQARSAILRSHELAIRSAQESSNERKEVERLNRSLLDISDHRGAGGVDQLRHEYDAKVQDLVHEREALRQELSLSKASGPGPNPSMMTALLSPISPADSGPTRAEVERVESDIKAIEKLLDDPDTSASTIALKSAQRAELEAYLRGILFQAGRARGV